MKGCRENESCCKVLDVAVSSQKSLKITHSTFQMKKGNTYSVSLSQPFGRRSCHAGATYSLFYPNIADISSQLVSWCCLALVWTMSVLVLRPFGLGGVLFLVEPSFPPQPVTADGCTPELPWAFFRLGIFFILSLEGSADFLFDCAKFLKMPLDVLEVLLYSLKLIDWLILIYQTLFREWRSTQTKWKNTHACEIHTPVRYARIRRARFASICLKCRGGPVSVFS